MKFRNFLFIIKKKIVNFNKDELGDHISADEYIELYTDTKLYRDEFLHLLKYSLYVPEAYKNYSICYGRNMRGNKKVKVDMKAKL